MTYEIKDIQRKKAKREGVTIKPSKNPKKKLDVFKKDKKVASIGAKGYKDYATYLKQDGKEVADQKRKNYLKRHSKEPKMKDNKRTPSYYADKILW